VPDYCVKISEKSDHNALQNLSSNPTANFSEFYNNISLILLELLDLHQFNNEILRRTFFWGFSFAEKGFGK
jgi:hypothetical protein